MLSGKLDDPELPELSAATILMNDDNPPSDQEQSSKNRTRAVRMTIPTFLLPFLKMGENILEQE
jgi:hypothetical protein